MGLADLDPVTGAELIGRDVGGAAVDREVTVADEVAGLGRELAMPIRYTTLSSRSSSERSRFSPVTPGWFSASTK